MADHNTFNITQGNGSPNIGYQLADKSIDLTGRTVLFSMVEHHSRTVIIPRRAALVVVPTVDPEIGYDWLAGDTDIPGEFDGEFILDPGPDEETVPNSYKIRIIIERALVWPKI